MAATTTELANQPEDLERELGQHRNELTGYCYRMLGSSFDADDAVQETLVRAWKAADGFEGRASFRSWLYRIATNVCLTMIDGRSRRAVPMDFSPAPAEPVVASLAGRQPETTWLEPIPDGRVMPSTSDPAEVAVARESIRLAFVATLQHLPAKQRAVLILREVLRLKADEVAELLDTTTASVNSALQRARATLATHEAAASPAAVDPLDEDHQALLERYLTAFESYDIDALVALLAEDATQNMPPYEMWLQGRDDIGAWMLGPGHGCRGSRMLPVRINGTPGFAQYRPSGPGGRHEPWGLHALEIRDGRVVALTVFLNTDLFALFGLPQHPDD